MLPVEGVAEHSRRAHGDQLRSQGRQSRSGRQRLARRHNPPSQSGQLTDRLGMALVPLAGAYPRAIELLRSGNIKVSSLLTAPGFSPGRTAPVGTALRP